MTVTINGSSGITTPEVILDNATADGGQVVLKSSGYSNWNLDNYSGRFRAYYDATEQLSVTSSGLLQFNSGYGSVATAYGCRAWVNFNGTGTVAIRASGNVSSITDNGTGSYSVNFSTAMPDTNYITNITLLGGNAYIGTVNGQTTSLVSMYGWTDASSFFDSSQVSVAIFR